MATNKSLKGVSTVVKPNQPAKSVVVNTKATAKNATPAKVKELVVTSKLAAPKKVAIKETKIASKTTNSVEAAKLTKPSTVLSAVKEVAKAVVKKIQEPVKKTEVADKKEPKVVTAKKEVLAEKKVKADVPVEKEIKPVKAASAKTSEKSKPVVIPKTSTDKKVDYEPDFMKSVLDAPLVTSQGPTMRYSDAELQEFRDLINKKLDSAKKNLLTCKV
jgi:hypothetical protein